jgi:hypothetical protein
VSVSFLYNCVATFALYLRNERFEHGRFASTDKGFEPFQRAKDNFAGPIDECAATHTRHDARQRAK